MTDLSIVTACTADYIWGAWLLVASLRRHGVPFRVQVMQQGFSDRERRLLAQFPEVAIGTLPADNPRNLATRKAEAMLAADSEWVAWMDSDCFAVGGIAPLVVPPAEPGFCARYRSKAENAGVFRAQYRRGDRIGGIPQPSSSAGATTSASARRRASPTPRRRRTSSSSTAATGASSSASATRC